MSVRMKVRVVQEYEATDLPEWLKQSAKDSGKSVSVICKEVSISTQYWYDLIADRKPIRIEVLEKIEASVGRTYSAEWREAREGDRP